MNSKNILNYKNNLDPRKLKKFDKLLKKCNGDAKTVVKIMEYSKNTGTISITYATISLIFLISPYLFFMLKQDNAFFRRFFIGIIFFTFFIAVALSLFGKIIGYQFSGGKTLWRKIGGVLGFFSTIPVLFIIVLFLFSPR